MKKNEVGLPAQNISTYGTNDLVKNEDNTSKGKLIDLFFELGIATADMAALNPNLAVYASQAKVAIYGIKATRLYKQSLNIFSEEQKLLNNNKIKQEDIESNFNQDMLDSLFGLERDQTVEEIKFDFLKKVILVGLTKDEKGRILAKHFFKTISELSPTEILILGSCYHFSTKDQKWRGDQNARIPHNWRQSLAVHTGVEFRDIIEETEENLTKRKLILPDRGGSNLDLGEHYRLTEYGYGLCKFVYEYDELMSE